MRRLSVDKEGQGRTSGLIGAAKIADHLERRQRPLAHAALCATVPLSYR
jgi:hypothetical protein